MLACELLGLVELIGLLPQCSVELGQLRAVGLMSLCQRVAGVSVKFPSCGSNGLPEVAFPSLSRKERGTQQAFGSVRAPAQIAEPCRIAEVVGTFFEPRECILLATDDVAMSSMSRGKAAKAQKAYKVVKPKKNTKRTTVSNRNHRFQSFTERISTLKIDPIRRRRHVEAEEKVAEETHTYFGQALEEWKDTNLSQAFTAFAKEASPLCDNLAVVLYNEDTIMGLLCDYIERGDALAMEPLLNLMSHFAHDLDTRFESHFPRAVSTVTAVAAKHSDFAVIEWSFTCLAWLFKYLSRLLTPDLRPLYDLMSPYMGKTSQKPFIVRFTAESLSFLVRKAAVVYDRDQSPLDLVLRHVLEDSSATDAESDVATLHQQGIMTMLTEAIKGVQNAISASGLSILQCLFKHALELAEKDQRTAERIVSGIMTSLIHHCTSDTFKPVLDILVTFVQDSIDSAKPMALTFCSRLLFTVASVRKGTRISDWKGVMHVVKELVTETGRDRDIDPENAAAALGLLAVAMQTATIDAVLATRQTLEMLRSGQWKPYFLKFADMCLRLGADRFNDFVLPHLQSYLSESPRSTKDDSEYRLILRIANSKPDLKLKCAPGRIDGIIDQLEEIRMSSGTESCTRLPQANFQLSAMAFFTISDEQKDRLRRTLLQLVQAALQESPAPNDSFREFSLGLALEQLLLLESNLSALEPLWPSLCRVSKELISLPRFGKNLLSFFRRCESTQLQGEHMMLLEEALISSLALPSHDIRESSLDILQWIYKLRGVESPASISTAVRIESTPISLETSRSISMNIRKLAADYKNAQEDELVTKAMPTYCFGLLHLNLAQAWDDAISALASMSQVKEGENVLVELAQSWLEGEPDSDEGVQTATVFDVDSDGFKALSDFECPNLAKMSAIAEQVFAHTSGGFPSPSEQFELDQKRLPAITSTSRTQALKVFNKIPQVAEKRSRLLVPVLLRWAGSDHGGESDAQPVPNRWARKDQKAMLAIFAQFVNPKVLYRSSEVYDALLSLCANGDVEIQRSALKAILAWKEPAVTRYEEHLSNLLDEARFREEISVFLRDSTEDDEEEGIRPEDHDNLMPVLLRLLYGRAVAGGKEGQGGRRKAIFVALSRFGEQILAHFLDIALQPEADDHVGDNSTSRKSPTSRQQFGMLNMVNDMLQTLGSELEPFASKILDGVLSCTISSSRRLDQGQPESDQSLLRSIRQAGTQCLVKVFSYMTEFEPSAHGNIIVKELIMPRLSTFAAENAQSVSGTLRLLAAWCGRKKTAQLFDGPGGAMLEALADLLQAQHTKDDVRLFILREAVGNLASENVDQRILQPYVSTFVNAIGSVIRQQPSKDVLDASVKCFSQLAGRINSGKEAADVTKICAELLTKPGKMVSPNTKTGLLRTLLPLVDRFPVHEKEQLYTALCALFSRLQESESRLLLAKVVSTLVKDDAALSKASQTCEDINAMGSRLDEPDHDRRERAFAYIYDSGSTLSLPQWLPIVHNSLYYVRDGEDRVNRASASHALQIFVDFASQHIEDEDWKSLLEEAVYAGIERGMRDPSELVRAEYLTILGHIVEKLPDWPKVSGMASLVVGGDEEASFFANVLHIQQHRRLRALRRLSEEATKIGSQNASRIFLPLLEHFVFDQAEGDGGRTLADQAVQTIGALAETLNKSMFRAVFQRYTSYLKSKEELEKTVLRLLGALVDGMQRAPAKERSSQAIIEEQLPPLLEYLHQKDESTVDRRMPVAVTIVKLMKMLPEQEFMSRLPGVLTDVCHVLRSRSVEARDETRKALKAIANLVGSHYFRFIVKELRGALKRGYQLHVLSFTVHALLVETQFEPGDIDECLSDLMLVIMDDIFGITGQEKDAEEYKSGMKEVKSSKSFDTLELLARVTPINKLGELVRPISSLLSEKVDMKNLKKIDELLTRLRKGLDQNPASDSREMLSFCWEVVNQVYAAQNVSPAEAEKVDERRKRYLVQAEAPKGGLKKGATTSYQFKLISFALNLLRKVLRRHEDLQTPQNMAGFLPMAGDALVQGQEEVKVSAVRLLSSIMRVSLSQLDSNAPVYAKEAVAMIKGATDMTTDAAKAALELITSILREKRAVDIKERDIALVLKRIRTDIDEPDRQGIIYKFLRAVIGRKIVITEVYETMDEVGKAMVTNPDRQIRESARSAYLQFVMEFPQGKDRWQKQTAFLVGHLQYEHAAGRQSVMEFLHQMLGKIGADVLAEIGAKMFVSLLPVIVGDSDNSCREMARLLVGRLFERAEEDLLNKFLSLMDTWLRKDKKASIKAGALQCWAILLRAKPLPQKQLEILRGKLDDIISDCTEDEEISEPNMILDALQTFAVLVESAPGVGLSKTSAELWQGIQQLPPSDNTHIQESVASLLGTFFSDVASTSSTTADGLAGLPLRGSGGLEIGAEDMRRLCGVNLKALRGITLGTPESLSVQIVRNLVFLGRCFSANEMPWREDAEKDDASDEETDQATEDKVSALANLLRRLASMLMADKFSVMSRTAALQCCSALINQMASIPNLQVLLRPLYALTDPTVPKPPGDLYKALEEKAHEALELIQKKIGSEAYVAALAVTRAEAKSRRDERRQKRRIEAVAEPERWAAGKKRKYEGKREKKKAKGAEARGKRRGW